MTYQMLRPAPGIILRLPSGGTVPEAGMELDVDDIFVRRRIAEGDLVPVPTAITAPATPHGKE